MPKWKDEGILKVPLVHYVEFLIPCILHLENRVGEKIVTMILRKGLELWQGPKLTYIKRMEVVFQRQVLRSEQNLHIGHCLMKVRKMKM